MNRDLSVIGHALAAPVRSTMLNLLMDGSTRPASELSAAAGVSASTASEHLRVLLDAGLISCMPHGRHRFYALADEGVASALEQLGHLCPSTEPVSYRQSRDARGLAQARLCYDHLAGQLGVALAEGMAGQGWVNGELSAVTEEGVAHLQTQGIEVADLRARRRQLIRPCADWTERRPHVAGSVGAAIADLFLERSWVARTRHRRGLVVTREGLRVLRSTWGAVLSEAS
ncbi:ArsR/SmtB family transcription factor [Ornithinimicrobium faecis]|uniref:ArsR/SmtB family transcription factor n=1 Tax=Ornithinimicrobium faecis TaxID=2934158 RepID=UPI002117E933|nr:winged helix-turn-helix domain-containing protein [Ornithinimicrobium sp. HY1745]